MSHNEYYLIVNGADEASIITDGCGNVLASNDPGSSPSTLLEWLDDLAADASERPERSFEVFVIHHGDHGLYDEECECIQFEADYNPVWVRNVEAGGLSE